MSTMKDLTSYFSSTEFRNLKFKKKRIDRHITCSDRAHNIAKLSQKSKLKLQLLAEMVIIVELENSL